MGGHAVGSHEPGEDPANYWTGTAWEAVLDPPPRSRFRQRGRFTVSNENAPDFSHGRDGPAEYTGLFGPHETATVQIVDVRFTPFKRSKLRDEIAKLGRLR